MTDRLDLPDPVRIVLADANVLYSRVLRDYLLYAAAEEVLSIAWSPQILAEAVEHLIENREGFTAESGDRLVTAMNHAFPYAEVEPASEHYERLHGLTFPDEDDRHVVAAALAAEATVLCTANTKDFPDQVTRPFSITVMTPDALVDTLIIEYPSAMAAVHATSVARLRGATGASTVAALRRAGASTAASRMECLLRDRRRAAELPTQRGHHDQ